MWLMSGKNKITDEENLRAEFIHALLAYIWDRPSGAPN